ncbi:MAG: site-2 protease family protein [Acidobacteria bacterium]|jgi:Zn-dependent protease|nr:site-2 protease family protein [Acidobacteriota bacterium]
MTLHHVDILFQLIVFLFAISIHESAHAWMANRCGDPTARMLGRITLNPIKHIDLFGTVLLPLVAMVSGLMVIGWAKPTPVNPRNFRHYVKDDILTSVVGPISNFVIAAGAVLALLLICLVSPLGKVVIQSIVFDYPNHLDSLLAHSGTLIMPLSLLLYELMFINVVLGVFNLFPVPPLDGSHVIRHFLPAGILRIYDSIGFFGVLILVYFGGRYIWQAIDPVLGIFNSILLRA